MAVYWLGIAFGGMLFLKRFKPSKRYSLNLEITDFLILISQFALIKIDLPKTFHIFINNSAMIFSLLLMFSLVLNTSENKKEESIFVQVIYFTSMIIAVIGTIL